MLPVKFFSINDIYSLISFPISPCMKNVKYKFLIFHFLSEQKFHKMYRIDKSVFKLRCTLMKYEITADSVSRQGSADVNDQNIANFRFPVGRAVLCPDGMRVELTNEKRLSCINEFSKNGVSDCFTISALRTIHPNWGSLSD